MTKWLAFTMIVIAFICLVTIETLVAQWLFKVFGYDFSFWTTFLILLAVDFLISRLRSIFK